MYKLEQKDIIYEDNHLIVIIKPVNIPSQADETTDLDMLTIVKAYIKEKYNKPGDVYLGLVHRLDRPVGGLMVFAKTSKSASRLSEQIRNKDFSKTYLAVVEGQLKEKKNTLSDYLIKDSRTNMVKVANANTMEAKLAVLDYENIETKDNLNLIKINLHTGRSHQIRVQFSNIGNSLYGDQRYNKNAKVGQQIALWAYKLKFKHPTKDEILEFAVNPPDEKPWNNFKIRI